MEGRIQELRQDIGAIENGTIQRVLNCIIDCLEDMELEDTLKRKELEETFLAGVLDLSDEVEEGVFEIAGIEDGSESR